MPRTPKKSPRQSPKRTGASARDVDLMARNAKHAAAMTKLFNPSDAPNTLKMLFAIRERPKSGIFVGDRAKWHTIAQKDREFIEKEGKNEVKTIQRDLDKLQRSCSDRRKQLISLKRSMPRPTKKR